MSEIVGDAEGIRVEFQCPNCGDKLFPTQVELLATYRHAVKTMEVEVSPWRFIAHVQLECKTCFFNDTLTR